MDLRNLLDPRRGAIRGSGPKPWKSQACRAGPAISGYVSLAIFDV
jgi:hypothetical protein